MVDYHKVHAPLKVRVTKKKNKYFHLNLNNYRNTHYQTLNKSKVQFALDVEEVMKSLPVLRTPIIIKVVIYAPDKRLFDVDNVGSIVTKYFNDCLVSYGKIPDDNYLYVPEVRHAFGGIDKDNPRAVVFIKEIGE